MSDEQVTPRREYSPQHTYIREGKIIKCFKSKAVHGCDYDLEISDILLFEITMQNEATAIQVMGDLYYGEYTGA